ncbi:P-loop containing nucleoside triphosphate hydrolase [Lasiodiplodia theobromae]|uniref:P-loop containing nucleoside triphosphate hydrolase n=1 Tax=Lasiodiplodia theobromae TaxID=45133 RepID=UPI0015C2DFE3|nr:P-loop containing nucleoside triphosphate hydrolase [Lasiodiplodia theobromae]KAF4535902.1 P-loop containing nucleoside triphosphate hydrolase [Lasiodiplodia theobromae]
MAGTDIAFLNLRLSEALRTLGDDVRCCPFVTTQEWSLKVNHFKNSSKTQISIYLNLYGPPNISAQVGKTMSKAGLFLQHPILLEKDVKYENPHYLNVSLLQYSASALPTPPLESPVERLKTPDLVSSVLDDLDQQSYLHMPQVDQNSIKTPLESHQKEALDFIFQREAEATPQPFSLWRPHTDKFQRQYYQNLVLGYRRAQLPDENFGGIIADEMGLGKTLTMLSAIFMSKGCGRQCIYRNVQTGPSGIPQRNTAATLVIVPSALILENWIEEAHSFQTSISRPIERGNSIGADRLRHLLKAVCIRRKKDRLNLPEPEELTQHVDMTQEETAEYSRIGQHYRQAIDDAVSGITLERFRKDSNVNVLLMTLGTGAVGLNLTVATRIHILEPQWNPLQESQAIGRAIRLGQKKQVSNIRFISYIQCRQSKKLYLARLGWDADEDETEEAKLKKLADLKSLLSLENGEEVPTARQDGLVECEMADAP